MPELTQEGRSTWVKATDGDIGDAYERLSKLDVVSDTLSARTVLVQTVRSWTRGSQDGAVLTSGKKCISMEFFAPLKSITGLPLIDIQFVRTISMRSAERYLAGEDYEIIECSDLDLKIIADLLQENSFPVGMRDLKSGATLFEGAIPILDVGVSTPASSPCAKSSASRNSDPASTEAEFRTERSGGIAPVLGCSFKAIALFRITLGLLLTLELVLRFRFLHPFYSDDGTLPLHLLMDRVDDIYKSVCLHCYFGQLQEQQILLTIQVILAFCFTIGFKTGWTAVMSWYLYFSLTLRNTWMNYILDRYFHYLLFLAIFLPLDACWSVSGPSRKSGWYISPATIAIKCLVLWIYFDAGVGKYMDPLGGWTYAADPLPALDTYARHTLPAQYLYALVGPEGLRLMTPVVVYVEIFAAPVALLGSLLGSKGLVYTAVTLIVSLHVGIAITLRNSALLSLVACSAWCTFLPIGESLKQVQYSGKVRSIISFFSIGLLVAGTLWLETISQACDQSVKHIWSTLLHNRWNVFVGAEEYVTWEIAPGMLQDGSVVDVWGRRDTVDWALPGGGAPSTSTTRPGRWRSFPYLAGLEGEEADALWNYLCLEWNMNNAIEQNPGRRLMKYNFFMLQADVLPEMRFSATRKRLIVEYECYSANVSEANLEPDGAANIHMTDADTPEAEPPTIHEPVDEILEEPAGSEPEFPKATVSETGEPEFIEPEHNEPVPGDMDEL